jgi:hypothetical protein
MSEARKITREILAREAAASWAEQYRATIEKDPNDRKAKIARGLIALGPDPDPDAVDEVIENCSWTRVPKCSACGEGFQQFVVQVGEAPDYESRTANLCRNCIRSAAIVAGFDV